MARTAAEIPERPQRDSERATAAAAAREIDAGDEQTNLPVVFFDGTCGLCNRTVDFALRHDRLGRLRFAPLQGMTAERLLPPEDRRDLESVVFWCDGRIRRRSSAIVAMLWAMGGRWRWVAAALWCVPRPLRDLAYRQVARRRYRWFGRHETCRMPTPEERQRLWP